MNDKDAVISGIKILLDGEEIDNELPTSISIQDFLAGNPGWQGSNTFIRIKKIIEAGSFDEKLLCTHDRDLAIRCLQLKEFDYILR